MRTAHGRMLRIQSMLTERLDGIHVAHFFKVGIIPCLDLLDLVRRTEAVKEIDEGDLAFERR